MQIEVKYNPTQKAMFLEGACQGVSDLEGKPLSPYMKAIATYIDSMTPFQDCLFLGGGAMIIPAYAKDKGMRLTVFEKNAEVYEYAKEHYNALGLGPVVYLVDAKMFNGYLDEKQKYGFILLDCYDGLKRPQDLYGEEFMSACKGRLTGKGTFCVNYACTDPDEIHTFSLLLGKMFPNVTRKMFFMDQEMAHPAQSVFFCTL